MGGALSQSMIKAMSSRALWSTLPNYEERSHVSYICTGIELEGHAYYLVVLPREDQ
jgi:hypothetical protein